MFKKSWKLLLIIVLISIIVIDSGDSLETSQGDIDITNTEDTLVASVYNSDEMIVEGHSTIQEQSESEMIDLTRLSSTMVYAQVYNMMVGPEEYIGKTVKMQGYFAVYEDTNTGTVYTACIVTDATACCSQGIEFLVSEDKIYPDDYPQTGSTITVEGIFETYEEGGLLYSRLADAIIS